MRPYEKFGPFMLAFPLGQGGMGEVFAARTPWPARPVAAVKRLREEVAATPTYAERFAHEAELAVRLVHPNIVDTIDVGAVDGRLYIASELILGKSVTAIADHLLMQRQGAPTAVVIRILVDVLRGLAHGHAATDRDGRWLRLVHRDVTPGNILVGYDGVARLTDFGLAKSLLSGDNLTQTGAIVGTPSYIAPELIRGEPPTPAADIYSLGAVAYRFLTGVPPFEGTRAEIMKLALSTKPKSVHDIRPDVPEWFARFVGEMLRPELDDRPRDARILAAELEREAQAHDLLIGAELIDVWLATHFDKDRHEALRQAQAIAAMDAVEPSLVVERTQTFARNDLLSGVASGDQISRVSREDRRSASGELVPLASPELARSPLMSPQPSLAEPPPTQQLLVSGALVAPEPPPDRVQVLPATPRAQAPAPSPPAPAPSPPVAPPRRAPLSVVLALVIATLMLAAGGVVLLRPTDQSETRKQVIARLDAVRARVDRRIENKEGIHPATVRSLADATRAALAGDYRRAELILSELERSLESVQTSTGS